MSLADELDSNGSHALATIVRDATREYGDTGHTHLGTDGVFHRCYHKCRVSSRQWFIGAVIWTAGFPLEHFLWEKVPPFNSVAQWMGLS